MSSTPVGYAQSVLHVYFTPVGTVSPKDFPVRVNTHVHHAGGTVLLKDQSHQANHLLTRACTMFTQITLVTFDVTRHYLERSPNQPLLFTLSVPNKQTHKHTNVAEKRNIAMLLYTMGVSFAEILHSQGKH